MALPEIVFDNPSDRSRHSNVCIPRSSSIASPLSIPNSREPGPPPPLPPPRLVDGLSSPATDLGWHWGNRESTLGNSPASVKTGSSLLGGSFFDGRQQFFRKAIPEMSLKPAYNLRQEPDEDEEYNSRKRNNNSSQK